jgi:hypothetical protein
MGGRAEAVIDAVGDHEVAVCEQPKASVAKAIGQGGHGLAQPVEALAATIECSTYLGD